MSIFTAPHSRSAALVILAAAVTLFVWLLIVPLIGEYRTVGAAITEKRKNLSGLEQLAKNQEELERQLIQLARKTPTDRYYVKGDTPALASANMQQQLERIVGSFGGELISTRLPDPEQSIDRSELRLQVHMQADIESLLKILHRLEGGQPLFFLDEIIINARPARGAAQAKMLADILDVRFDLIGYVKDAV